MIHFISVTMLLSVAFLFSPTTWQIPAGTQVHFSLDGILWTETKGTLTLGTSTIEFDPNDLDRANINVTISISTINTGNVKRDAHLRNEDFFDGSKYPTITFHSVSFVKMPDNTFNVLGNLRIKSVVKPVTIPFTFSQTGKKGVFKGDFKINRMDYGVGTGYKLGMGREVRISLNILVNKQ